MFKTLTTELIFFMVKKYNDTFLGIRGSRLNKTDMFTDGTKYTL